MPLISIETSNHRIESENTRTTIRVFAGVDRVFSCEITTTAPDEARITSAAGEFSQAIKNDLIKWLAKSGYRFATYERLKKINGNMCFKRYRLDTTTGAFI